MSFADELLGALPKVRPYAARLAGQDADDLMQEAVARALAARSRFAPETQMAAWLRTIVHNTHASERRKAWRYAALDPAAAEAIPAREDAQERLELVEVLAAIQALPDGQRPILEAAMLGYSVEEAAQRRGCAVATAKNQLLRGRATLRERFGDR